MRPVEFEDCLTGRAVQETTGCLVWTGGKDPDGYGITRSRGVSYRAHRVAWVLANGRQIPAGLVVRHKCDNPPCINPDHLELGTVTDNNQDRERRGRGSDRRGSKAAMAKLTEGQIPAIRAQLAAGASHSSLAEAYGVSRKAISKIFHHQTWSHVA